MFKISEDKNAILGKIQPCSKNSENPYVWKHFFCLKLENKFWGKFLKVVKKIFSYGSQKKKKYPHLENMAISIDG